MQACVGMRIYSMIKNIFMLVCISWQIYWVIFANCVACQFSDFDFSIVVTLQIALRQKRSFTAEGLSLMACDSSVKDRT